MEEKYVSPQIVCVFGDLTDFGAGGGKGRSNCKTDCR